MSNQASASTSASTLPRAVHLLLIVSTLLIVVTFTAARMVDSPLLADWLDNLHWTIAYCSAAALGWYAMLRADESTHLAKRWFAYGLTICALGQLCWDVQTALAWQGNPAPSDFLFLCFGPCCVWGMLHSIRQHQPRPLLRPLLLDVITLSIVVLGIVMTLFLPRHGGPVGFALAVKIAYPISMLGSSCLALIMWPTLRLKLRLNWLLWVGAYLLNGIIWLQWIYLSQADAVVTNTWLYLLFSLVTLLLGVGAIRWRPESSNDPLWAIRSDNLLRMLPLLVVGGAAISVGLAWSLPGMSHQVVIAISISAILVFILAVLRQSLLLYERERLLANEHRANELERTFKTLFNITRGGLALIDHAGRFHETNPGCSELLGYSQAELQQLTLPQLWVSTTSKLPGPLGLLDVHDSGTTEADCRRKDGIIVQLEQTSVLIPDTPDRIFVIFRDITKRKRAAETQARLEAQLRQSQKLEAIGTLASGIAHDFNNILGAILGNIKLAAQDLDTAHPSHTSLNEVRRAGLRARELITRIVAFGKPQDLNFHTTQLGTVIEDSMKLVRATLPATVQINYQLNDNMPPVSIDSSQIGQVLLNLCTNAYQAMPDHKGCIVLALLERDFSNGQPPPSRDINNRRYACLQISDNGCGIDPQITDRIFEPFFTTKPMGEGSGLGLSIVHNIIRSHGGAITVSSVPGKGTRFDLYLPICNDSESINNVVSSPPSTPASASASARGTGQHVMYVDDEEALVFLAQRMLERFGYRVSGYTQPEQALAALRQPDSNIDVVITDYSMPVMSGTELAQAIQHSHPHVQVILVSGYLSPEQIDRALNMGIREVILKPDTTDELAAKVHRVLSN